MASAAPRCNWPSPLAPIASAAAADSAWVRACGADIVFDYHDPDLFTRIAHPASQGIDLYWDNSGHHDFEEALPLLGQGGRIIISAGLQASAGVPIGALYTRYASMRGFAISNASVYDLAGAAALINRRLSDGNLKTRIGRRLPLSKAAEANRLQEAHGAEKVRGRIAVILDDRR